MFRSTKYTRPVAALIAVGGLLASATVPTYASTAPPPPPPPPPIQVPPPPSNDKDCEYVFGYQLQQNAPPVPFLKLECPASDGGGDDS
ncbi:MAG: hypothetical protein JO057_03080 [Chloroflexi bacterium]|nr:hypothetical protein [Chloroflexota bacterium]